MASPVHKLIVPTPDGKKLEKPATTRCGLVGVISAFSGPYAHLLSETGGNFKCAEGAEYITCRKCRNLLDNGTIHARPWR